MRQIHPIILIGLAAYGWLLAIVELDQLLGWIERCVKP